MNTVILRNIPAEIMNLFRKRAAGHNISLNKAVLGLLQEQFGFGAPKIKAHHDLDAWLMESSWTDKEADEFNRQLLESRREDARRSRARVKKLDEYSG